MPSLAETPQKPSRKARHPRKKSTAQSPAQTPSQNPTHPSMQSHPNAPSAPQFQILRRGDPEVTSTINNNLLVDSTEPATPQRPRSMYEGSTKPPPAGNDSGYGHSEREKKAFGTPKPKPNRTSSPNLTQNGTPLPVSRPGMLTPGRLSATPSRAYAGPTFHASPAASSLPMPKFFSRSVPNVDKTSSLKHMMEENVHDTTSGSEGSPLLESSQPVIKQHFREESPLDVFFRADREAKAKDRAGIPLGSSISHSEDPSVATGPNELDASTCRPSKGVQTHARHPSTGGMFALEMDSESKDHSPGPRTSDYFADSDTIESNPSNDLTEDEIRKEECKTKTLALKRLLFSPPPQYAASSQSNTSMPIEGLGSPAKKECPGPRSPSHHPSASPNGFASAAMNRDQRQAALLALAEKQISNTNGFTSKQPGSSNLRQEMKIPVSPASLDNPEPPTTPTPSRVQNPHPSIRRPQGKGQVSGYVSPYRPFTSSTKQPQRFDEAPVRDPRNTESVEDDLRRILKLDVLSSDGVTGIRS